MVTVLPSRGSRPNYSISSTREEKRADGNRLDGMNASIEGTRRTKKKKKKKKKRKRTTLKNRIFAKMKEKRDNTKWIYEKARREIKKEKDTNDTRLDLFSFSSLSLSLSLSSQLHTGGEIDDTRVERCGECEEICQRWRGEKRQWFYLQPGIRDPNLDDFHRRADTNHPRPPRKLGRKSLIPLRWKIVGDCSVSWRVSPIQERKRD